MDLDRRKFIRHAGAGLGALGFASTTRTVAVAAASRSVPVGQGDPGLPKNWRTMRKFDAHNHVFLSGRRSSSDWTDVDNLIEAAGVLGIERIFCSLPITGGVMANIDVVRDANNSVLESMKRHPKQIAGYCFVQPGNGAAALDEMERCLDAGMMGVKLYNQFKFTDPEVFPIAEKCIARGIPFLGHSAFLTDPRTLAMQPKTSHALDFCALARRYPELLLIVGHVNGGGDWEWQIKGLRECANVYIDTSGSVLEDDTIGQCVRALGHQRVLFATDGTLEGCVGKILSAELTPAQREDIFWRNFQRILDRKKA
jgi:predicted TIM-barrel fold metal-dependent hydrolase